MQTNLARDTPVVVRHFQTHRAHGKRHFAENLLQFQTLFRCSPVNQIFPKKQLHLRTIVSYKVVPTESMSVQYHRGQQKVYSMHNRGIVILYTSLSPDRMPSAAEFSYIRASIWKLSKILKMTTSAFDLCVKILCHKHSKWNAPRRSTLMLRTCGTAFSSYCCFDFVGGNLTQLCTSFPTENFSTMPQLPVKRVLEEIPNWINDAS